MGWPRLFSWVQFPLLLRLKRADWISSEAQLLSPFTLPAGWYVLSIRCLRADHELLAIQPGQYCSLGRGQLRRRVVRLSRRQQLRLDLVAPLETHQVDQLDLLRVPGWRAWQLINRKLRRFQLLERGCTKRRNRWLRYNRILSRSGASRVSLSQWLRHLRFPELLLPMSTEEAQLPSGWTLLRDPKHILNPLVVHVVVSAFSGRDDLDLVHGDYLQLDANGRPARAVLLPVWDQELFAGNPDCQGIWFVRETVLEHCRLVLQSEGLPASEGMLRLELLHQLERNRIAHFPRLLSIRQQPFESAELTHWEVMLRQWLRLRRPDLKACRVGDLGFRLEPCPSVAASPTDIVRATIIIPTRDCCDLLRPCLESIQTSTLPLDHGTYEILVIDNGSTDVETLAYLQEIENQSSVRIVRDPGPFNYSRLNNKAVSQSQGRVLLFLNNDTEVISVNWLQRLVLQAERLDVGAVGACLLYSDGYIQHGGVILGIGGVAGHAHKYCHSSEHGELSRLRLQHECAAVTGAVLAVERHKFLAVSGFDETSFPVNYNDVDLCLRLACQGWRTLCCPDVRVFHYESRSRGAPIGEAYHQWQQERAALCNRWGAVVHDDPWYNPNFSRNEENYSLRLLDEKPRLRRSNLGSR